MIVVTGATGIVGAHILLELALQRKNEVLIGMKQPNSSLEEVQKLFSNENVATLFENIQWIDADITDGTTLENIFIGVTTLYHCAAFVSFDEKDAKKLYETNVIGTKNIINYANSQGVKNLLMVSSIATMDAVDTEYIDESSEYHLKKHHSAYAQSKYEAEMEAWRASQEGMNVCIINPSVIICEGFWNRSSGRLIKNLLSSYYIDTTVSLVHAKDVARCAFLLVENKCFNQRYIVVSETIKLKTLLQAIAELTGKKPKKIPFIFVKLFYYSQKLGKILGIELLSKPMYNILKSKNKYTNQKIVSTIGYNFTPILPEIITITKTFITQRKNG